MKAEATEKRFPAYGFIGLALIVSAELGLIFNIWLFEIFMTAICWTGLILFLDAVNFKIRGNSLIMSRRKEFLWMLPLSVLLWYFFEFYNLFIGNWYYVGLPESRWLRYFGYFWAFATIWPGVFEIYELVKNLDIPKNVRTKPVKISGQVLAISVGIGLIFMVVPLVAPQKITVYLAAPVWVGMVLLLDPFNFIWKRQSIWKDLSRGDLSRLFQLFLAGLIAGFLWEFWNYWATAKWIYTVPILENIKIFEMPVVGYLGFPAFAVEIFVMWEFVKHFLRLP